MVECIFLFYERFHKSLLYTSTEADRRKRTGCEAELRAASCRGQAASCLERLKTALCSMWVSPGNGLWRSRWVSHFAESEAEFSLKNTQLWHSFLHCSAGPSFIILSIFRTRMKTHFFTLFYWEPWTVMNIGFCFVLFCFLDTLVWFPTRNFLFKDIL